jgi:hypothetical protein
MWYSLIFASFFLSVFVPQFYNRTLQTDRFDFHGTEIPAPFSQRGACGSGKPDEQRLVAEPRY